MILTCNAIKVWQCFDVYHITSFKWKYPTHVEQKPRPQSYVSFWLYQCASYFNFDVFSQAK